MNTANFTRTAARMVARNDRPTLRSLLIRAARRVGVLWCAVSLAGLAIYMVPPYTRFYS